MSEDTVIEKPIGSHPVTETVDTVLNKSEESSLPGSHTPGKIDSKYSKTPHHSNQGAPHNPSKPANLLLNSTLQLSERQEMVRIISNRLFVALFVLLTITMIGGYLTWSGHTLSTGATNWMVILCGAIGGFISLQRRLKTLVQEDLLLLARSWVYVLLAPLVGGILALLLYFLFISGLLEGDLFPDFHTSSAIDPETGLALATQSENSSQSGMTILFQVEGVGYKDYAKLVFWCFLAGYSESFVTNIISQFESSADQTS